MNVTSAAYPRQVSEFSEAGLTPVKADIVNAPMVAESPIKMECRVLQIIEFGKILLLTALFLVSIAGAYCG